MLGVLACFVGVFVTGAIGVTALNESYLRLITADEEQRRWRDHIRGEHDVRYSEGESPRIDSSISTGGEGSPEPLA